MPESDRSSPEHWLAACRRTTPDLAQALESLPSHDAELARAIAQRAASCSAMAGTPEATGMLVFATPILVEGAAKGDEVAVHSAVDALSPARSRNLQMFERAAAGHGLLSAETEEGVVRRIPMVASIEGTLVPSFALELAARRAEGAARCGWRRATARPAACPTGGFATPTEADGARPHPLLAARPAPLRVGDRRAAGPRRPRAARAASS